MSALPHLGNATSGYAFKAPSHRHGSRPVLSATVNVSDREASRMSDPASASQQEYLPVTLVMPEKSLLHKYYSQSPHPLGRLAMRLIELKRPRNGDLPWIWTCRIWKDDERKEMK
jgi:hypothetical protein